MRITLRCEGHNLGNAVPVVEVDVDHGPLNPVYSVRAELHRKDGGGAVPLVDGTFT